MLQSIRQSTKGTTAKIIIGLIVISFAFFGIQSILVDGGGNAVAEVNGEPVSPNELNQAVLAQQQQLISRFGDQLDPSMLERSRIEPRALNELISRKLLVQAAESMRLAISEPEIGSIVAGMEQFQVDGVFSPERYKMMISQAGYSPGSYKLLLRNDLLINQMSAGLAGSEFVTQAELDISASILAEQRDFSYFTIPGEEIGAAETVSEAEIESYYAANEALFRTEESVDVDYIELKVEDFRQSVEESVLREAYELGLEDAVLQDESRVSHILFEDNGELELLKRVQDAQARLATGEAFTVLAKDISDDVGSADRGGDLGYTSGAMFPDNMEAAIASLEPGIVSEPIETSAGTHLLLVTERKAAKVTTFEEMRDQLEERVSGEDARSELLRTVETLRDLSFNAEDLEGPAADLDLQVLREEGVIRGDADSLFGSAALNEAAFSDDVLVAGHNSEVFELSGDRFVVLRVRKHDLPQLLPVDTFRDQILVAVQQQKAVAEMTRKAGASVELVREGELFSDVAQGLGYKVLIELGVDRKNSAAPMDVLSHAFQMAAPSGTDAAVDFFITPAGNAVVIELQRVEPGNYTMLPETERTQLGQVLTNEQGGLVFREFQRQLRNNAEITSL